MIGLFVRALSPFFAVAPIAVLSAAVVAAVCVTALKQDRLRLQRALIGAAFGLGASFRLYQLIAGIWFMKLGGSGEQAAIQAQYVAGGFTALTVFLCVGVAVATQTRALLIATLPLAAYFACLFFFTAPIAYG